MYKLDYGLKKIISPVHIIQPVDLRFADGGELAYYGFEENYLIKSIKAVGGEIEIVLEENRQVNSLDWTEEKAVSFF